MKQITLNNKEYFLLECCDNEKFKKCSIKEKYQILEPFIKEMFSDNWITNKV